MKKSILLNLFIAYMLFGILMGVVAIAISNKDLTHHCVIESNDVIGEIIDSFNAMATNLLEMIIELQEHCRDIEYSVTEVASVSADSAQSTDMQFSEVKNIQDSILQLQEAIALVANNTSAAMILSNETTDNVNQGNQVINQTMIERLQKGALSALELMERSTSDAASGVEVISKTDDSLNLIIQAMSVMNEKNQQIKQAADDQLNAIEGIHENIKNVSYLTANSKKGSLGSALESEKLKILTTKLVHMFDEFKVSSEDESGPAKKRSEEQKQPVVESKPPVVEESLPDDDDVFF